MPAAGPRGGKELAEGEQQVLSRLYVVSKTGADERSADRHNRHECVAPAHALRLIELDTRQEHFECPAQDCYDKEKLKTGSAESVGVPMDSERIMPGCGRMKRRFGSAAWPMLRYLDRVRGEQRDDSDTDILIEFDPTARITVFDYAGIKDYISHISEGRVDVVNSDGLKPYVKPGAAAEAIYAF